MVGEQRAVKRSNLVKFLLLGRGELFGDRDRDLVGLPVTVHTLI